MLPTSCCKLASTEHLEGCQRDSRVINISSQGQWYENMRRVRRDDYGFRVCQISVSRASPFPEQAVPKRRKERPYDRMAQPTTNGKPPNIVRLAIVPRDSDAIVRQTVREIEGLLDEKRNARALKRMMLLQGASTHAIALILILLLGITHISQEHQSTTDRVSI